MGDWFRLLWGLLYWNAVKTRFVVRGRPGTCRCQAPSDSGRAWETHCEAAMGWDRAARFRRICPALQRGPDGWRCSVNTAEIRPHWGRALGWYGGGAAGLLLLAITVTWGGLRYVGYSRISWLDVALPGRWSRFSIAQREVFIRKALGALERRDLEAMRLSLASAAAITTDDYEARLLLAHLQAKLLSRTSARAEFDLLFRDFPAQRERTAIVLHDLLLSSGDFDELARFSLQEVRLARTDTQGPWKHSAITGLRGSRTPRQVLQAEAATLDGLSPGWISLLRARAELRAGGSPGPAEWLAGVPRRSADTLLMLEWLELVADAADPITGTDLIAGSTAAVGAFHRERLLYRLQSRTGRTAAPATFDRMLGLAREDAQRARMLAALVEYPDARCTGRLLAALLDRGSRFTLVELGGIWMAAVRSGHVAVREAAEKRMEGQYGRTLPESLPRTYQPEFVPAWIEFVPMDRNVAMALALTRTVARR